MFTKFFGISIIVLCIALLSCSPQGISDPIPTMRTLNVTYYASDEFYLGSTGIETAIPMLREEGVRDGDFINIAETSFFIERQEIDMNESYIIRVGGGSDENYIFSDIIEIQGNEIITSSTYEKQNISCRDPVWVVESLHPVKITVEMKIHIFSN